MWCGQKMLELKAEFEGLVENELHRSHPAIRVGIQQRRAISIVPEVLQRFMEKYPDVEVIFRDGNQAELMKMFQEGSVDYMISVCSGGDYGCGPRKLPENGFYWLFRASSGHCACISGGE